MTDYKFDLQDQVKLKIPMRVVARFNGDGKKNYMVRFTKLGKPKTMLLQEDDLEAANE